jgi:hypothetical protein
MKADIQSQILLIKKRVESHDLSESQKKHLHARKNFLEIVLDSKCSEIDQKTLNFVY